MGNHLGLHILLDLYECQTNLDSPEDIQAIMIQAAKEAHTTVLNSYVHKFSPQGVSCVVVISESHLSIHTWPEHKHAEIDVFTCGSNALPTAAVDCLQRYFQPRRAVIHRQKRGDMPSASMNL